MRVIGSAILAALFSHQALAAGLTKDELRSMGNYLYELYSQCDEDAEDVCVEPKALALHPDLIRRDGKKLILALAKGEKVYEDAFDGQNEKSNFLFIGYVKELDGFILNVHSYECINALLVDRKTGKEMVLNGTPLDRTSLEFSNDGTKMVDYASSPLNGTMMDVYSYDHEKGFAKLYDAAEHCIGYEKPLPEAKVYMLQKVDASWNANGDLAVGSTYMYQQTCELPRH